MRVDAPFRLSAPQSPEKAPVEWISCRRPIIATEARHLATREHAREASTRVNARTCVVVAWERTPRRLRTRGDARESRRARAARSVDTRCTPCRRARERTDAGARKARTRVMPCPFAPRARETDTDDVTEVIITDGAVGTKRCVPRRRR